MTDCLFCRIARHEIAARIAFESDNIIAFHDLSPQAPVHLLLVPKRHISSLGAATGDDAGLLGELMTVAQSIALELGIADGFRLVANSGAAAGQSVFHLHLHLLGGRSFGWPPG